MKTTDEIIKHLGYISLINCDEKKLISFGLAQLWNNEEVVNAYAYHQTDSNHIALVTDKARLIICNENLTPYNGMNLFKSYNKNYNVDCRDLTYIDKNKSRINSIKEGGFFGNIYYKLIFECDFHPVTQRLDNFYITVDKKKKKKKIFNMIISASTKYGKPQTVKQTPQQPITQSGAQTSNIVDIRKLYEDGLITKEEMIDLIKSLK